jgi:hypothetical protein
MRRAPARWAAAAALAAGGAMVAGPPASAQPGPVQVTSVVHAREGAWRLAVHSSGLQPGQPSPSPYWAGYESDPSTGVTSAELGFVVPSVSCKPATSNMAQSLQIVSSTGNADFQLNESCTEGALAYFAGTSIGGVTGPAPFKVSPGDKVGALVTDTAAGDIKVEAENFTSHKVFDQTGTQPPGGYAVWGGNIDFPPEFPIPTFTRPIPFLMTVNGRPLSAEAPVAYDLYNGPDLMIRTSPLNPTGDEFTTIFVANR